MLRHVTTRSPPALLPYESLLTTVQHLTPTWRLTQQRMLAQLIRALVERPTLCLADLARALPAPAQPLHGRYKRLDRWLANPRLDELALAGRLLRLTGRFAVPSPLAAAPTLQPILLDTTSFAPSAVLLATVPVGGRGLPIAWTTCHRTDLTTAFPPDRTWPRGEQPVPARRRGDPVPVPAASQVRPFLSQNAIEEYLLTLLCALVSPGWQPVIVADRGFARAGLFRWLQQRRRDFVIRFDTQTCIQRTPADLPQRVEQALGLRPGERRWLPDATYHAEERVPVAVLGVWEPGHDAPGDWATTRTAPEAGEKL